MRFAFAFFLLMVGSARLARSADDGTALSAAQKLFDAMKAHDRTEAASLFLPGSTLSSVDANGKTSFTTVEKFVEHIGTSKHRWLERIWNTKTLEHGSIAIVWANYDFYLDGKFSHCGVDSFQLLKTDEGWKIAAVSDSRLTTGCEQNPAGAPKPE